MCPRHHSTDSVVPYASVGMASAGRLSLSGLGGLALTRVSGLAGPGVPEYLVTGDLVSLPSEREAASGQAPRHAMEARCDPDGPHLVVDNLKRASEARDGNSC